MNAHLAHTIIRDAMPLVAALLTVWLTRDRGPRPPSGPTSDPRDEADLPDRDA
ncbi:hypothetical protein [Actinomadura chokoriensis]|uniref:Uncharacterized protein n=1 Tax=Actinomadura chokoriensis TaxID=454156 RepID=A0ABV4QP42_9ACTN